MIEALNERLADAKRRYDTAAAELPIFMLDGDEAKARKCRQQREEAAAEAADIKAAIGHLARRERAERDKAEAEHRKEVILRAKRLAADREEAASVVDASLVALEKAVGRHRALGLELSRLLKSADICDDRIARMASQDLRWATWESAPEASELLQVPRAPSRRRRSLEALQAASVPSLPEGKD